MPAARRVCRSGHRAHHYHRRARRSLTAAAQGESPSPSTATQVRDWTGASALGRTAGAAFPDRQRRDHRRQLRGLAVLRAPAPAPCRLRGVLLSLHGQ
jgi:hypothetical protein